MRLEECIKQSKTEKAKREKNSRTTKGYATVLYLLD